MDKVDETLGLFSRPINVRKEWSYHG